MFLLLNIKTAFLITVILLIFAFLIWWLNHSPLFQNIWNNYSIDSHAAVSFCEKTNMSHPVRQPVNTFSNSIYFIVSLLIFKKGWKERNISIADKSSGTNFFYQSLLGLILLFVFGASTFYHASLLKSALKLDYSAVFSFSLFPLLYFSHLLLRSDKNIQGPDFKKDYTRVILPIYLTIWLSLSLFTPKEKVTTITFILIVIFICLAITTETFYPGSPKNRRNLITGILSILSALLWFEFDKYKVLCNPSSYFQPHSLWNLFIAVSAFYFFMYMGEKEISSSSTLTLNNK